MAAGTYAESVTINKNNLTVTGDVSQPAITGGLKFDTDLTGLTFKNFNVTGSVVSSPNSIVRMGSAITDLTVDNCVFDGENIANRFGFSGGQIEGDLTVTNSEFKNILGWALFDTRSGSSGDGSAMGTVTFANNNVHDSNGSVVFRGLSTDRTDVVNVYGNTWDNIGGNASETGQHRAALEVNRAQEVNVYDNTVNDVALGQWNEGQAFQFWNIDALDVHGNTLTNNAQGIYIRGSDPVTEAPFAVPGRSISFNNIVGNTEYGIKVHSVATGGPLNNQYNWWGDDSGPDDDAEAINGSGDAISTNVDADPWLDDSVADFEKVATTDLTSIGPSGGQVKVTITAGGDASNYLDVYQVGSLSGAPVTDESYPVGFDKRSNIIWGIKETGTVTATLVFDYSSQPGVSAASTIEILKRDNAQDNTWALVDETSRNDAAKSITLTGVTDFSEYALGGGGDNSLPVTLTSFTARQERGFVVLEWVTESEIDNLGFIVERKHTPPYGLPSPPDKDSRAGQEGNEEWGKIASYITHPELQGQGSVTHRTEYRYTDNTVEAGKTYEYRVADVSYDGVVEYHVFTSLTVQEYKTLPDRFTVYQNYPNPFNAQTTISYYLPSESYVTLTIYDLSGRDVQTLIDKQQTAGLHSVVWDARRGSSYGGDGVSSGLYFYRIESGKDLTVKKLVLLK